MNRKLGRFAEYPEDINGTPEEWIIFNNKLAQYYYEAMISEDWDLLEDMNLRLISDIYRWIDYNEKNKEIIKDKKKKIINGTFITSKNRTFIEAIISEKKVNLATTFILLGNNEPNLFLICIISDNRFYNILNKYNYPDSKNSYILFLKSIFKSIEKEYNSLKEREEKIVFLNKIKPYIQNISFPKYYGEIKIEDIGSYNWTKKLIKTIESNKNQ